VVADRVAAAVVMHVAAVVAERAAAAVVVDMPVVANTVAAVDTANE
jgi:hypothetical protein